MAATPSRQLATGVALVKGVFNRQIDDAIRTLRKRTKPSDKSIHDARKNLKRARASLRLLRDAIGTTQYTRENTALRDAARPLTPVRDAKVMLDITKGLIEKEKAAASHTTLVRLRRAFLAEQRRREAELLQRAQGLKAVIRSLEEAGRRARHLKIWDGRLSTLCAGMKRIYRKGRKAMKGAAAERSDQALHEARKQVKYLGAAMITFDAIGVGSKKKQIEQAESIADDLGDDHDLALLSLKLAASDKTLAAHLKLRRAQLQKKALNYGRQLYKKKPRVFAKSLQLD